ncbi:MAG TPA: GNAT family N-acetyltransferase [Sphingomicrobium sp.]|nr:GNAT family N-acetyltransferase [Sphingomicrobium sp.]
MGLVGFNPAQSYSAPVPITAEHRIEGFDCGRPKLTEWLKAHALENEGRSSRTYVAVANTGPQAGDVVGYYTLATGGVTRSEIPRKMRHGSPNPVPVMVLGRLAVDERHQKKGIGPAMLKEAMQRTIGISRSAGVRALVVHAVDDDAVTFSLKYGFILFPAESRTMFLPIETLASGL